MIAFQSLAGRLLVAMPGIGDPRFENAVILVCAHGPDHGMGLRIDRPAPGVTLKSVLTKLDIGAPDRSATTPVLSGGPVERERGFVLHTDDWMVEDCSSLISEGLALTATREALSAMTDPLIGPRRAVLLLGYAGWGDGQLEEELADNVWLTADADQDLLFDTDFDTKWSRALAGIGVDAARLSRQSGRA
jgi:putative transcriptional regulator